MTSRRVLKDLSERFNTIVEPSRRVQLIYYDTVDWRLYNRRLLLIRDREEYELTRLDDHRLLHRCTVPNKPRFWRDFPAGPMRNHLRRALDERAVLPVGRSQLRVRNLRVLNADDKTVVRARLEEGQTANEGGRASRIRLLSVWPIRGYDKEARRVSRFLHRAGLVETSSTAFEKAVQAGGRQLGDYSSKFEVQLDASVTAQQAAASIFSALADVIEHNVDGVRRDIDTEVVHDFRVAIRRTRSGLSLMKGVVPRSVADEYGPLFAKLGRASNRLRDLDVYLLIQEEYRSAVDKGLRPALDPLFEKLSEERTREHNTLVELLESRFFENLLSSWRSTLRRFGTSALKSPKSATPVGKVANRLIAKRYRVAVRAGERINESSPDEMLHALRIDCKKLRYALEFFASLYPANDVGALIKQLKRLQDNLGEFNDLAVQRAELRCFLEKHRDTLSADTGAAIGTLIANMDARQREVRSHFHEIFASFVDRKTEARFKKMFG